MYTLRESNGPHRVVGYANGTRYDQSDGSFWVIGWSANTQLAVSLGGFYLLEFPHRHTNIVRVVQIGGSGREAGIRFEFMR